MNHKAAISGLIQIALLFVACSKDEPARNPGSGSAPIAIGDRIGSATGSGGVAPRPTPPPPKDIDSKDILARTEVTPEVTVKHVLLAWKDLAMAYPKMDPRAAARTNDDAAALAQRLLAKLTADPKQLDALVSEHSEDPGMAGGGSYNVTTSGQFVPPFRNLSLRLHLNEAGIVRTQFGYHVIMRIPPPPPDPVESADILARAIAAPVAEVQHVLVSWKDLATAEDPRAKSRTKAQADALAKEILTKARGGGDFAALMKAHSEDPGSKDSGRAYGVTDDAPLVDSFKRLAMRLAIGEVGIVKSEFGFHIMKRIPPDKLMSTDVLDRQKTAVKVTVKHILLGWTEANVGDPRGAKRSRAEVETLVKATVARLAKGEKIEPIMKDISEHADSAKTGNGFDITATTEGLPGAFKRLSLRLAVNEVGVVKSEFGIHIIQRAK